MHAELDAAAALTGGAGGVAAGKRKADGTPALDPAYMRPGQTYKEDHSQGSYIIRFETTDGECAGPPLDVPRTVGPDELKHLINHTLGNEEPMPYSFLLDGKPVDRLLWEMKRGSMMMMSDEDVLPIVYIPEAVFKVRTVTRCTSSLSGHAEAVIAAAFAPNGQGLATGSGDCSMRLWDINTECSM